MNQVYLWGALGADPEMKVTQGGATLLKFRMATNERVKRAQQWEDHTEWHSIVVWGKRAEALSKLLSKGTKVLVRGNLRTSSYEGRDGVKRYKTEITAEDVQIGGGRAGVGGGRRDYDYDSRAEEPAAAASDQGSFPDSDYGGTDDNVPF